MKGSFLIIACCVLAVKSLSVATDEDVVCERTYDRLGCYEEKNPGVMLLDERANVDWDNIAAFMHSLACQCAALAQTGGYAGFALHYYGECYGRTSEQLTALTSKSSDASLCVGDQTYSSCDSAHAECTGKDWAEAIYKFKSAAEENVDGGLSAWQEWTTCDKQCGPGFKHRERNCNNPEPKGEGKDCGDLGQLSEAKACEIKKCAVNGNWGAWGSYGACSKNCGTGSQSRSHSCNNPSPANGGAACAGSATSSRSCNTDACPSLSSCTTKYTTYQTHSSGKMTYLDRHPMNCGGANSVLTMFHLQRSSKNMRYQYKCCTFQADVCQLQHKYTSFSNDGNGDAVYLDRHTADCSTTGFINYIKVERDSGHDNVRYNYYCSNLDVAKWQAKASCYSGNTAYTDDGDGKVYYLDRQTVSCSSGYALSYVKLQRTSSHKQWRYNYRCCKVAY